jgi:hypothetical protein
MEPVFAKPGTLLRTAATRTREALQTHVTVLPSGFSQDKGRNHITNSSYAFMDPEML